MPHYALTMMINLCACNKATMLYQHARLLPIYQFHAIKPVIKYYNKYGVTIIKRYYVRSI